MPGTTRRRASAAPLTADGRGPAPIVFCSPAERDNVKRALDMAVAEGNVGRGAKGQDPIKVRYTGRPEKYGVDFAWIDDDGCWHGVQRKTIDDFIASLRGDRLAKELGQMRAHIRMPMIALEGPLRWTMEGTLAMDWGVTITKRQWHGTMFGLSDAGVHVHRTRDIAETCELVVHAMIWTQKAKHGSLLSPPKAVGEWGTATNEDYQLALLQMVPGVGIEKAKAIRAKFGGVPWAWTCTVEDLMEIDGIGKTTAMRMMRVLDNIRQNTPHTHQEN